MLRFPIARGVPIARGAFIAWALVICSLFLVSPARAQAPATQPDASPVIAVFELTGDLQEQPADDQASLFGPAPQSLRDIVERMNKAARDPNVKAVVIMADDASFGFAQAEELRQAIGNIRAAGKEVWAQGDSLMMRQYVLLSGATHLSVAPTGDCLVAGLHGSEPYLKGLLEKIGVQPDFLHCGAYKSASEVFMRDGPSPEAEAMENWLLDSVYSTSVHQIAQGRNISDDQARAWIDQGLFTSEKAKAAGMIDATETRADMGLALKQKFGENVSFDKHYGQPAPPTLDFSNPFSALAALAQVFGGPPPVQSQKPAIGVVYIEGMILQGKGDSSPLGTSAAAAYSTDVSNALDDAASDDSIKAVVLRIDSPGGSATGSEIMLRAAQRLHAKKPLVVSMGDLAASGGYFAACSADKIFADRATLTASIGVVGGKFATTDMWSKIGVTWKSYDRGASAGILSTDAVFTPDQRQRVQAWMDEVYGVFKDHVVAARGDRLKKPIDDLAAGRVYTGEQALQLGLVDELGTLADATAFAAQEAKVQDYDVRTVPKPKSFLERLIEQSAGGRNDPDRLSSASLLRLAAPYLAGLDAQKVRSIETDLIELQMLQSEGVLMIAPAPICCTGR